MKFRERKNKGEFSVMEEISVIEYVPTISQQEKDDIKEQTELADAPVKKRRRLFQENSTTFNSIQPPSVEVGSSDFNHLQPHSSECHSNTFNSIQPPSVEVGSSDFNHLQPPFECHSTQPSMTEVKVLSFLTKKLELDGEIKTTKSEISAKIGITIKGAETALRRLIKKGYLIKKEYQSGRFTGFTKFEVTEASTKVLISMSFNHIQPHSQPPSYKEINNKNYIFIPENLKQLGLKSEHIVTQREDLTEVLEHLSFSITAGDFKSTNPLATVRSILNENKQWTSGKLILEEQNLIAQQSKKIEELKALKQQQLINEFEIYRLENPDFEKQVKQKQKMVISDEVFQKILFEEWAKSNEF